MAEQNAAPDDLEVVRGFVNTLDVESGRDEIAAPASLQEWFVARGLLEEGAAASEDDVAFAAATREALRRLMHANLGGEVDAEALVALNRAADASGLTVRFDLHGAAVATTAPGLRGAVGALLAIASGAMREGEWSRLKACDRETCRWAFYDHSRNRSGRWCSMEVCGNRTKVEKHRGRHA